MSVTALVLLGSLAFAAQAQICTKPSGRPNMNLKGDAILQDTFPDGSSVSFACNVGYISAGGSPTITCTAGSWSTLRLVCERRSCGSFPEVDHGTIDYPNGDALYGDKVVVTCNSGYILVGKKEISCGDKGWMNRPPVCEVVSCSVPGQIENGVFNPQMDSYTYRDVVRYSCNSGFTLNGSRELTCSEDEQFHPDPPKCVRVECKDAVIPNSEFVEGSRPPHKMSASITYICKNGYEMIGESTITCNINSQWSPGLPYCRAKSCSKPSGGSNMHLLGNAILQDTFPDGSSVSFACNVGYTSTGGSATITCTTGTWSTLQLGCKTKSCGALPEVEHGTISYPSGGTLFGDKAVVTCNSGYTLVGHNEIICGDKGWIDKSPKCEATLQLQCDKTEITAHIGEEFVLVCKYDFSRYLDNKKYWCRGFFRTFCQILLDTDDIARSNRSQIFDAHRRGLSVKVTNLQIEDSGVYWVGINKAYADIMVSVRIHVTEVPVSKPRLWPLSSLVDRPTCWGEPLTVRCGCTKGTDVYYTWYQHSPHKDFLLQRSSDLTLHCGTMSESSRYYCVARNSMGSEQSDEVSVHVLIPANSSCIYVVKIQGQPAYDCEDRMRTTTAESVTTYKETTQDPL